MKKNLLQSLALIVSSVIAMGLNNAKAQCTWKWQLHDGYEYTGIVPDLIPGTTIHNTPQMFSVHSGTYSLYMNFVNTLPAGSLVYQRTISVCPGVPIRLSSWLTTTFSGVQCDMHLQILDANNIQLANTPSLMPDYSPIWTQYQSGSITPSTSTITFKMFTNVGGSQVGNDLSMDDFLVEQCNPLSLGSDTTICNSQTVTLDAGSGYTSYLWNNGTTLQTLVASTTASGTTITTYSVTATNSNGCSFQDTIKVTFTVCSSVPETINENSFSIFPNPATDYITIAASQKFSSITLFNVIGEKIKEGFYTNRLFIGDVPKGLYFLQLGTSGGQRAVRKILVN